MDLISASILAAITAGASETGKNIIGDTYNALKNVLKRKWGEKSDLFQALEKIEEKKDSAKCINNLQEEVKAVNAFEDPEVKYLAKELLKVLQKTSEGQSAMEKYHINADKIGIVGDNVHIEGGQYF